MSGGGGEDGSAPRLLLDQNLAPALARRFADLLGNCRTADLEAVLRVRYADVLALAGEVEPGAESPPLFFNAHRQSPHRQSHGREIALHDILDERIEDYA